MSALIKKNRETLFSEYIMAMGLLSALVGGLEMEIDPENPIKMAKVVGTVVRNLLKERDLLLETLSRVEKPAAGGQECYLRALDACGFMREEFDDLGLTCEDELTSVGVNALRDQRDVFRYENGKLRAEMTTLASGDKLPSEASNNALIIQSALKAYHDLRDPLRDPLQLNRAASSVKESK